MRRLFAWLWCQLVAEEPAFRPVRPPVDTPTPPPTRRLVARGLCPFCSVLVWEGEYHDCGTLDGRLT